MSNSDNEMGTAESAERLVQRRASELRASKDFDPRREKELNDLYNQYIPPHSVEETSHLLDVAERDAYIDPFPPIGSQKMAGAAIKKSVRVAIGWYIQYIAQQISTFGSGVAQALRSIHNDVEDLKKTVGGSDMSTLLEGLDLGTIDKSIFEKFSSSLDSLVGRIVVSDSIEVDLLSALGSNVIVIDPRSRVCSSLPAAVDSRCKEILSVIKDFEDQSLAGLVLHGRIDFLSVSQKAELIANAARVLSNGAPLVIVVRTQAHGGQAEIAYEISGASSWSKATWQHVISRFFDEVEFIETSTVGISSFIAKNKPGVL